VGFVGADWVDVFRGEGMRPWNRGQSLGHKKKKRGEKKELYSMAECQKQQVGCLKSFGPVKRV